ncbi:MAG TPA: DUF6600 domain-containing protein, partial [Candidatus Solibacter sp.]|nr:DUF6600 domain-containing protein [Candidatus Solibacter sp.]
WEDWYGWTWVSSDPWGWAPYHYGRWFRNDRFGWCWYPGVFGARHYWSPALVGFFGFGNGVGVGFGFGNIGWVPLAPFEVFRPWWGRGFGREGFNRSLNITNINIGNTFRNARFNNGISAVGVHEFQNGRFNNVQRFNGSQIHEAGLVRGQMPIAPSSANLRFSDRQAVAIPRSNENARFFTHQQPNPVARQSLNGAAVRSPAAGSAGMVQRNSGTPAGGQATQSQNGNASWRRFGSPAGQSGSPQSAAPGNQSRAPMNQSGAAVNQTMRNDRPAQGQPGNSSAPRSTGGGNNGGWQRFGAPGDTQSSGPRGGGMHYNAPSGNGQNIRISPPVVRERSYSAPAQSAPRQSAPSSSAPRGNSGGGGGSRPSGGGNRSSGSSGSTSHGSGRR